MRMQQREWLTTTALRTVPTPVDLRFAKGIAEFAVAEPGPGGAVASVRSMTAGCQNEHR